jgi:hypothetical protein
MNGRKKGQKGPKNAKIVRMRQKIVNLRHRFAWKMAFLRQTNQKNETPYGQEKTFLRGPGGPDRGALPRERYDADFVCHHGRSWKMDH